MTGRELLRVLGEAPDRRWPDAWLHHGFRVALLLALAIGTVAMFPTARVPDTLLLEKGMVPEEDVIAEFTFDIYKSDAELSRDRQAAASSVNPIFVYDSTAVDSMLSDVDRFFGRVDSVASGPGAPAAVRRRIRELVTAYGLQPTAEDLELLREEERRALLHRTVDAAIRNELATGVVRDGDLEDAGATQVRLVGVLEDRVVRRDSLRTEGEFFDRSRFHVPTEEEYNYEQLQRHILIRFFVPSIRPAPAATEAARQLSRSAVPLTKGEVLRGERVITARERVDDAAMDRHRSYLRALEERGQLDSGGRGLQALGALLFNLIAFSLLGTLLYLYRPTVYRDVRHVTLVAFLVLSLVGGAAIIAAYDAPEMLIPIAFPALVVATLWDGRLALNLSLIMAVLLTGQTPFLGLTVLLMLVTAGAVASLSVRVVRTRAQTWGFIMLIAGAYLLTSIVLGLIREWSLEEILVSGGWGALNAVASAFAAMGFLPLFESYTRITTDQTLLELADANRPLLRRLSMEAPGTYAHSINVANLAEAAADAIDANALLTRVGTYYHDVGKMAKPHYFIENQPSGRNPHDKLKPAMSATVVRNHVIEGLRLAEEAKLPDCVRAFIAEHHGTQAISFFLDQAREQSPDEELDARDFSYPGPRPQSRETAILMLADSVESAARVLPDPSPDAIRELVDRIVRGKMDAGQLDDTPLTLAELSTVKATFANVLTGMYHHRIDYPPTREGNGGASGDDHDDGASGGEAAPAAAGVAGHGPGPTSGPSATRPDGKPGHG